MPRASKPRAPKPPPEPPIRILPLIVTPKQAGVMLSMGPTQIYRLISAGDLVSFLAGSRRKITVQSIYDYINRGLTAQDPDERPEYSTRSISQPGV